VSTAAGRGALLAAHLPMLMLVTDAIRLGDRDLASVVDAAVAGGVNCVQLRERSLPHDALVALVTRLRDVTSGRALLLVNTDIDAATHADGVHLPERAGPIGRARALLGEAAIVSCAVHSVDAAVSAVEEGADMLVFGPLFATTSHPGHAGAGIDALRDVCAGVAVPVIAIGGITAVNAPHAIDAGARGVAVIGAIFDAPDPRRAAAALRGAVAAPAPP
jgi:thiamine-phosphate pyrophosphorylase